MSLNLSELRSLGAIGQGDVWTYRTEDDVTVAGYFSGAAGVLGMGDVIHVTVLTDMNTTNEAWVGTSPYVVTDGLVLVGIGGSSSLPLYASTAAVYASNASLYASSTTYTP